MDRPETLSLWSLPAVFRKIEPSRFCRGMACYHLNSSPLTQEYGRLPYPVHVRVVSKASSSTRCSKEDQRGCSKGACHASYLSHHILALALSHYRCSDGLCRTRTPGPRRLRSRGTGHERNNNERGVHIPSWRKAMAVSHQATLSVSNINPRSSGR
jgi:hypothetical protein